MPIEIKPSVKPKTAAQGTMPNAQLSAKQAIATTSVTPPNGPETTTQEAVGDTILFTNPTCNVGVNAAQTINLGNYSNVKLGVSINIPCAHTEIDEVFEFAKAWVDNKMVALTQEATAAVNKAKVGAH